MNSIVPFWCTPKHQRLWPGPLCCLFHYFVEGGQFMRCMREFVADPPLDPIAEQTCILGHSIYTWRMVWRIEAATRNRHKLNCAFGCSCILSCREIIKSESQVFRNVVNVLPVSITAQPNPYTTPAHICREKDEFTDPSLGFVSPLGSRQSNF